MAFPALPSKPLSNRLSILLTGLVLGVGLAACNPLKPYRMEIQQGNFITQEQVDKLKPGMSKEQVRFVLGTPLLVDVFHPDRWDYVYRRQKARSQELEERRLTLFFESNRLTRTEGSLVPAQAEGNDIVGGNGVPQ
jgi:outer membrane protein assembly factor BamE